MTTAFPDDLEPFDDDPDSIEYVNPDWSSEERDPDQEELDIDLELRDLDPQGDERDDDGLPTDSSDETLQMDFTAMNEELFDPDRRAD